MKNSYVYIYLVHAGGDLPKSDNLEAMPAGMPRVYRSGTVKIKIKEDRD